MKRKAADVYRERFVMGNEIRLVPVTVYVDGVRVNGRDYEQRLWIEDSSGWYEFMTDKYKGKRVRVVTRAQWLASEIV